MDHLLDKGEVSQRVQQHRGWGKQINSGSLTSFQHWPIKLPYRSHCGCHNVLDRWREDDSVYTNTSSTPRFVPVYAIVLRFKWNEDIKSSPNPLMTTILSQCNELQPTQTRSYSGSSQRTWEPVFSGFTFFIAAITSSQQVECGEGEGERVCGRVLRKLWAHKSVYTVTLWGFAFLMGKYK